jgi:hypothetical protein
MWRGRPQNLPGIPCSAGNRAVGMPDYESAFKTVPAAKQAVEAAALLVCSCNQK